MTEAPGAMPSRPSYMTPRMWFVWLLRGDLRGGFAPESEEGQREFLVWWLLWGHGLFGSEFAATAEQLAVAVEPVPAGGGAIPRLLRRLHRESPDLRRLFDLDTAAGRAEFLAWFRLSGLAELERGMAARPLPGAAGGIEVQARLPPGAARMLRSGVQAAGRDTPAAPEPQDTGPLLPRPNAALAGRAPFGVNLVGFASGELGLGEDVRMMSRALGAAGVAHVVVDLPNLAQTRAQDRSLSAHVVERPRYPITVFCLNPFDTADFYARGREDLFAAAHNIGLWAWELPRMPPFWRDAYRLVDEVWAATRFTWAAFRHDSPVPVQLLPPCVEIPDEARVRAAARKLRERRGDRFRFVFPFDRNSALARKNPWAAVAAFREAFPPDDRSVELLLRINGERGNDDDVARLRREAAADPRIVVQEGTLPRVEALALLASSDCLVSPHRAEGFGRNIAEAILLDVPVLATGFGGCADFLNGAEAIAWQPVGVRPGEYPHAVGQWWAEPDVAHLARRMAERRQAGPEARRANQRREEFRAVYGAAPSGARYAARLRDIHAALVARKPAGAAPRRRAAAAAQATSRR